MNDKRLRTEDAIKIFGTKYKLAQAARVTRQAVQKWGEFVPTIPPAKGGPTALAKLMRYKSVREFLGD